MRQHAIPQNVLDVEFKLFTKFTVKEFVYMMSGITLGAIFIFFWTEGLLPGILAFPSFLFFAGIGLILGLVPINDQPAEKFILNYIQAINTPTLRVWQNKDFKDKMELIAQERGLNIQKIDMKTEQKPLGFKTEGKIIGGLESNTKPKTVLDLEEEQKLEKIDILFEETGLVSKNSLPKVEETVEETVLATKKTLVITHDTITEYLVPNLNAQFVGTLNMVLENNTAERIGNATVIIKDTFQKPILAIKSDVHGEVLTNRILPKGEYNIEILHNEYTFPQIKFLAETDIYPLFKITTI